MKSTIKYLIVILIFLSSDVYPQSGWIQQQSGLSVELNSAFFLNSNTGWICGDSGKILKTTNGGTNWILQTTPTRERLMSIFFLNANTGWSSGGLFDYSVFPNREVVIKTTNGGNYWFEAYYSNSSYTRFESIYFIDEFTGVVVSQGGSGGGNAGYMYRSTNGGGAWTGLNVNDLCYYTGLNFTDSNTGWVLRQYGDDTGHDSAYILKSTNSGINWFEIYKKEKVVFTSNYFLNNNTGWISGLDHSGSSYVTVFYKTTNGGENFIINNLSAINNFTSMCFTDHLKGWGCNARIYRTTNSGSNWEQQLPFDGTYYHAIRFTDSLTGWAVGTNGKIIKTFTGGINSSGNNSIKLPESFYISQNYPNPFNPVTNLEFGISDLEFVSLKVYDVLGNEIKTLVNENKSPGTYRVEFDGSNLSSGMYFYKITAGEFTEVKKMTLLK